MKKLFIRECKPRKEENFTFKRVDFYYDTKSGIPVYIIQVSESLTIGRLYDFAIMERDYYVYEMHKYLILGKLSQDTYLAAEFFDNELFKFPEEFLSDTWKKCNVSEMFGIDVKEIEESAAKIY